MATIRRKGGWAAACGGAAAMCCWLATGLAAAAEPDADWPQWRGPLRDGVAPGAGLLREWPADGPPVAWRAEGLGKGYSSVAVANGRVYTLSDLEGRGQLLCLDAADGKRLWTTEIGAAWDDGGPRSAPTVANGRVFALGPHGDLVCCAAADGAEAWRINLQKEFGGRMMSGWGYSESPLADGGVVVCTPGADAAALVALDAADGKLLWKAAIPDCGGAGYASPVAAELAGRKQYVTVLGREGGCVGVDAANGKLLWRHNGVAGGTANVPTPIVHGDIVFYSTGYGDGGSAALRIERDGDGAKVSEVWRKEAGELRNHHGGVVLKDGFLYGGHGQNQGFPFCVELATGKQRWRERGPGGGSAAVALADGHLYFRYDNNVLALLEANPDRYVLKAKFQLPEGRNPGWAHPAIARGKLYLRDQDRLWCFALASAGRP